MLHKVASTLLLILNMPCVILKNARNENIDYANYL